MALHEAQLLDAVFAGGPAAEQGPVPLVLQHLVPEGLALLVVARKAPEEDGGRAEGVRDFVRQAAHDVGVGAEQLGPALLQHHHPDPALARRLGEERLVFLVCGQVIVYNHLLVHSVVQYSRHVDSVPTYLQRS